MVLAHEKYVSRGRNSFDVLKVTRRAIKIYVFTVILSLLASVTFLVSSATEISDQSWGVYFRIASVSIQGLMFLVTTVSCILFLNNRTNISPQRRKVRKVSLIHQESVLTALIQLLFVLSFGLVFILVVLVFSFIYAARAVGVYWLWAATDATMDIVYVCMSSMAAFMFTIAALYVKLQNDDVDALPPLFDIYSGVVYPSVDVGMSTREKREPLTRGING